MAVASVGIFSGKILDFIPRNRPSDLWKEILPKLIKSNEKIMAYESSEYVEDMGTPKRLRKVRSDFKTGRIFHG
jgi:NDP-sugar pyrophosphorylase family protein